MTGTALLVIIGLIFVCGFGSRFLLFLMDASKAADDKRRKKEGLAKFTQRLDAAGTTFESQEAIREFFQRQEQRHLVCT